ncbi:4-hydroxyphenylacetate 3-hydroxylase N-terminal domain-containing protein [Amycolatopsis jejuensis]|uniref:4-hydroxyphenylacetate 3-hydroxylase N-terminal domain-containing protein n=1 Tax=Amycolatopsis jejuensis TaxID=330084 RepID=UPI00068B7500|nr:4-hydroxyphenylacetate 3-hydroxylase N-terminal domain-containing protein [Amycolatopsis jejuensis]
MRTGAHYRKSLQDGRSVYVDGRPVSDVTTDPELAPVVSAVAGMYDYAGDHPDEMVTVADETGRDALAPLTVARSPEQLAKRTRAMTAWAELTGGWLTRTPDHVAAILGGLASCAEIFDEGSRPLGRNVRTWYQRVLDEALYVTYASVPPPAQVPRTVDETGTYAQVHRTGEDAHGIRVSGALVPGAAAAVSDVLFLTSVNPLTPDDGELALAFVVPVATPGVRIHCRPAYRRGADEPLAGRFDELDALVVLEDVAVPWENVFVCGDLGAWESQFRRTPGFLLAKHQNLVRLTVKSRMLAGLAKRLCELKENDGLVRSVELLGEIGALAALTEASMVAAEAQAVRLPGSDVLCPAPHHLTAGVLHQVTAYPRAVQIIRELAGGEVLDLPRAHDLADAVAQRDLEKYGAPAGTSYSDRRQVLRLAWDCFGSEFAGRQVHFEALTGGVAAVKRRESFERFDFGPGLELVGRLLAEVADEH